MKTPAKDLNWADGTKQLVGLHISVPSHPIIHRGYPPSNLTASLILHQTLARELKRADLLVEETRWAGEFNESTYLFEVRASGPALAIIKAELENLALLSWAQLAYFCWREDFWRTMYPNPEPKPFAVFVDPKVLAGHQAELDSLRAAVASLLLSKP